ncbi:MAG: ABC transporter ATP-binding protein [Candidatus Thermoplasmatota archaeon]
MGIIEAKNISYTYDDGTVALKNIKIDIEEGEKIAIMGPNGAGKSTLLHLLCCIKIPSEGELKLFNIHVKKHNANELRKRIGIIFQDPDDQIFMPRVWDDVAFGPINLGLEEKEVRRRVEKYIDFVGIKELENRVPHHLSYGEKKKVAIAGVLAMEPEILLLDEPTANLDPRAQRDFIELIKSLKKTIVLATHDINLASILADRGYILKNEIIANGTLKELFSNKAVIKEAFGI